MDDFFPLTPALSPDGGEGAGTTGAFGSRTHFRLLLPLGGEGRDEGRARQSRTVFNYRLAPGVDAVGGRQAHYRAVPLLATDTILRNT